MAERVLSLRRRLGRASTQFRTRLRSVRGRTALAAVAVVGVALIVAGAALVVGLRFSLTNYVRTAAQLRAEDVADLVAAVERPTVLAIEGEDDMFVQVVEADGQVVVASPNMAGLAPVIDLEPGQEGRVDGLDFEDDEFLVVAVGVEAVDGDLTVLVGRNLEVVEESTGTVLGFLIVGIPLLLLVVAATIWRLAGRALAPVEEIRSKVEGISADELSETVPVPPTEDEIARLAATMNAMLGRLHDAQIRQRQFVSDAGHELKSPLATMRQHAEVALAHPERSTTTDLAEVVLGEDLRLQRLVEDLLWLARIDEGAAAAPQVRPVDVDDLVLEELARLRAATDLQVDGTGLAAGRVLGDGRALRRLVRNLTDNAGRHARTTVALSLTEDDSAVVLRVDDDGAGIPPADRTRVFERFVRLDEARSRDAGGSGLGLAIAAEIVRIHGGTVTVDDSPLGGARFQVRLPAAPE